MKKIHGYVVWNCESLEGITFPEGVEEIGDNAFSCCHSFENFVIPDSVKIIGEQAFSNCHNLKSITVPASVTEIDKEAFSDEDTRVDRYKPSKNLVINCFKDSAAHKYALENGNSFKVVDADDS